MGIIVDFLDEHNGSITLLTTIITIIATIYIGRLPYKKIADVSLQLKKAINFKPLCDEKNIRERDYNFKEYCKNHFIAIVNIKNIGLCDFSIKKIVIKKERLFKKECFGEYEIPISKKDFYKPMDEIREEKIIVNVIKNECIEKNSDKFKVIIYFDNGQKTKKNLSPIEIKKNYNT